MKCSYLILIGIMLVLCTNLAAAQPPFIQPAATLTEGYDIRVPEQGVLRINESYEFRFHVFNISNGVSIGNESTQCYFHLYFETGIHLIEEEIENEPGVLIENEWEVGVDAGNFTLPGTYSYIIQCNSSVLGGAKSVGFEILGVKEEVGTGEALIYVVLFLALIFIFLLSLYGTIVYPWDHSRNAEGEILSINDFKYVKVLLFFITYLLLMAICGIVKAITQNFLSMPGLSSIFNILYWIMFSFLWPLMVVLTLIAVISHLNKIKVREDFMRGDDIR